MSTSTHWTNGCHILSPVLFLTDQHNASENPYMNLEERTTSNMVYFKQFYLSRCPTHLR